MPAGYKLGYRNTHYKDICWCFIRTLRDFNQASSFAPDISIQKHNISNGEQIIKVDAPIDSLAQLISKNLPTGKLAIKVRGDKTKISLSASETSWILNMYMDSFLGILKQNSYSKVLLGVKRYFRDIELKLWSIEPQKSEFMEIWENAYLRSNQSFVQNSKIFVTVTLEVDLQHSDFTKEDIGRVLQGMSLKIQGCDLQHLGTREGSIILEFAASVETGDRLQALFQSNELIELAGFKILDITILAEDELDQAQDESAELGIESIEVFRQWLEGKFGNGWVTEDEVPQLVEANRAIQLSYGSVVRYKYLRFPTCVLMLGVRIERTFKEFKVNIKLLPDMSQVLPDLEQFLLPVGLEFSIFDGSDNLDFTTLVEDVKEEIEVDIYEFVYGQEFSIRLDYDGNTLVEKFQG